MPAPDILIAFVLATAVFAYMPGPSMLYTAAQTLARGPRAGWFAAMGIHVGGYVHVLAAALGLAVLFQAVPVLYATLKLAGAGYLIWLGIKLMRNREASVMAEAKVEAKSPRRAFWESVSVEVLNPKTAIFYVAFLPQFTDPSAALPLWAQLMVLGTVVNLMFSSADAICVLLADRITRALRGSNRAGLWLHRLGGGILIGLGLRLGLARG
jgi:threonine/homoserine/homoserine lactone efflux protein